ncbi:MAG: ABC transporter ATP-binding protein [Oscillospiraceae bacterium]|nr:ABC transporter ATP-binding protein [Oscillospiraceae bacterium]
MININNISKSIDNIRILKNINLKINTGSVFGLTGANGAGKSTLLRMMCGIYAPESGEILFDGEPVYDSPKVKNKIFFVNDETVQYTKYTLTELKNFYKIYYPNFSEELFDSLTEKVKLPRDKKLSSFSKGMKRQAIVITGISCQTEYLILDEAFDGLDPAMRTTVKNIIFDAVIDRSLTVVLSSHNIRELNEICDSAAMIKEGTVTFVKDISSECDIFKITTAFRNDCLKEDFPELDIVKFEKNQNICTMIIRNKKNTIETIINKKNPAFFNINPLTLEEIFIVETESQSSYENH